MYSVEVRHSPRARSANPLAVRASLSRTFGSLAGFAALVLLALGVYLLADAFAHPVDAAAAALIVAGFAIALALLLFFFLFKPQKIPEMSPHQTSGNFPSHETVATFPVPSTSTGQDELRKDSVTSPAHQARGIAGK